jgi:hypothetical protein
MRKVIFIALSLLSVVGYGQGIKISALPQAGSLTGSELTPVVQNGITKKTTVQSIANLGGGGGSQNLQAVTTVGNTTSNNVQLLDSGNLIIGAYGGVLLDNSTSLKEGTFDNGTGGSKGISLNCAVGYELNWQGGHLSSSYNNGTTFYPVIVDTALQVNGLGGSGSVIVTADNSGLLGKASLNNLAWSLTGNSGTDSTNFIGTTDAKDFVTKTNGIERFRIDTNGYILLGDRILSIRDSVNPKNILNINDADLSFQVGSSSDSFLTTFSVFNTTIEEVISSSSTGISIEHYMDTMQSMEKLSYNGLEFQQGVYDNEGTKVNITTEMNIFSPSLDRDIAYLGMHYGHWEYFISDTSSGGSELPQGHGVFGLDSLAFATHVTEKPTSEYASKFATKFLADTAFKFMIDSNETPIFSLHRNGVQIIDGTEGVGKVLTSDATGLSSWQTLSLTDTATLNFGSIGANGHEVLTMTVTGAALSDVVSLGIPNASMNDHASFVAWVSSANTVSVKCFNFDGSSFNPAAGLFTVKVFK